MSYIDKQFRPFYCKYYLHRDKSICIYWEWCVVHKFTYWEWWTLHKFAFNWCKITANTSIERRLIEFRQKEKEKEEEKQKIANEGVYPDWLLHP